MIRPHPDSASLLQALTVLRQHSGQRLVGRHAGFISQAQQGEQYIAKLVGPIRPGGRTLAGTAITARLKPELANSPSSEYRSSNRAPG